MAALAPNNGELIFAHLIAAVLDRIGVRWFVEQELVANAKGHDAFVQSLNRLELQQRFVLCEAFTRPVVMVRGKRDENLCREGCLIGEIGCFLTCLDGFSIRNRVLDELAGMVEITQKDIDGSDLPRQPAPRFPECCSR